MVVPTIRQPDGMLLTQTTAPANLAVLPQSMVPSSAGLPSSASGVIAGQKEGSATLNNTRLHHDPPPYPGHVQSHYNQSDFRKQRLSSSDTASTDVSMENLGQDAVFLETLSPSQQGLDAQHLAPTMEGYSSSPCLQPQIAYQSQPRSLSRPQSTSSSSQEESPLQEQQPVIIGSTEGMESMPYHAFTNPSLALYSTTSDSMDYTYPGTLYSTGTTSMTGIPMYAAPQLPAYSSTDANMPITDMHVLDTQQMIASYKADAATITSIADMQVSNPALYVQPASTVSAFLAAPANDSDLQHAQEQHAKLLRLKEQLQLQQEQLELYKEEKIKQDMMKNNQGNETDTSEARQAPSSFDKNQANDVQNIIQSIRGTTLARKSNHLAGGSILSRGNSAPETITGTIDSSAEPIGGITSSSILEAFMKGQFKSETALRRSFEMLSKLKATRSNPDLMNSSRARPLDLLQKTSIPVSSDNNHLGQPCGTSFCGNDSNSSGASSNTSQQASPTNKKKIDLDHAAIATRATQMVERLSEENRSLRQELDGYHKKVAKLQKFEVELEKVGTAYETLVKHSNKRENLEKLMRLKLESEIRKLKANEAIRDQLKKSCFDPNSSDLSFVDFSQEGIETWKKKDGLLAKIVAQNKELSNQKARLEMELTVQHSTVQKQQSHINLLEEALTQTQASNATLETEKKKYDRNLEEIQGQISNLQKSSQHREELELRLRKRLEEEVSRLRTQVQYCNRTLDSDEGIASDTESCGNNMQSLIEQLQDKETRILQLEAENARFEQRYLEEKAMREMSLDAVMMPKDARIAALEQSSRETEKIISEGRSARLKHLEEVYHINRRCAELEARTKSQAAQLSEKEAIIDVLQRGQTGSSNANLSCAGSPPSHSPLQSLLNSTYVNQPSFLSRSSPGSTSVSRQNSQLDTHQASNISPILSHKHRENLTITHAKSNSTGSSLIAGDIAGRVKNQKKVDMEEIQSKIASQSELFRSLQSGADQLSKCLWEV